VDHPQMSLIFHFREDGRVLHFLPGVSRLARRSSPENSPVHCYICSLFRQRGFLIAKNYAILVNFGGYVRIFDGIRLAIVPSGVVKVREPSSSGKCHFVIAHWRDGVEITPDTGISLSLSI